MPFTHSSKPVVFLFSGHGTQYYQMGIDFYTRHAVFKQWMDTQDEIIQRIGGYSVLEQLFNPANKKSDHFDAIRYTHTSLFMVQYALARLLMQDGIQPDLVAGTSLGEYVALTVGGAIPLEDMLQMLVDQSDWLLSCEADGGMMTVLDDYETRIQDSIIVGNAELAAINDPRNFVLAGEQDALKRIEISLKGICPCFRLPVKYAFHSSFMDQFQEIHKSYFHQIKLSATRIPYYSCVYGKQLKELSSEYLWEVVRKPIQFLDTLRELESRGPLSYVDLSPTGTLSNFVTHSLERESLSDVFRLMNPYQERGKDYYADFQAKIQKPKAETGKVAKNMKAFVFPGQGSQRLGMGKDLFDEFKDVTAQADAILGYSIRDLCLNQADLLDKTEYTQPAIYVVNALHYMRMMREQDPPAMLAGHSLGEYNALQASGVISFEEGLRLVIKRSQLMAQTSGGGMAAVIGHTYPELQHIIGEHGFSLDIANHNTPTQIVVAGLQDQLEQLGNIILGSGKGRYVPLRVSGPFHSKYMSGASRAFMPYLEKATWRKPEIPVIANVTAQPYGYHNIHTLLAEQIDHSIRWTESIQYMLREGITSFIEVGDSIILSRMIQEIKQDEVNRASSGQHAQVREEVAASAPTKEAPNVNPPVAKKGATQLLNFFDSSEFLDDYGVKYPYVCGGMHHGVSSVSLVLRAAKAGMMAYFGTSGLSIDRISQAIDALKQGTSSGYGMNLTPNYVGQSLNASLIDLFLQKGVCHLELSGFITMDPAVIKYRLKGLKLGANGSVISEHKIMAKLSRPEIAAMYLSPAPQAIVDQLLASGEITEEQAFLSRKIAIADDICIHADSAGMTDRGSSFVIFPSIMRMAEQYQSMHGYAKQVRLGIGGGIGCPDAAAAAFLLGAKFIVTGSINQCTVEAGTSDISKQLLASIGVQDTEIAPSGEMFELGAKVQVLKKGVFFPARANRLYEAYKFYPSLDDIDPVWKGQIQKQYLGRSFEEIYETIASEMPAEAEQAQKNPKYKMALIFRQYFRLSTQAALEGNPTQKVNYQIPCGPSMGAFNQWINGTPLEDWRLRHVDEIGLKIVEEAKWMMNKRLEMFSLSSK